MRLSRIPAATIAAGRARLAVRVVAGEEGLGGAAQGLPSGAGGMRSRPAESGRCASDHRSRPPAAPPSWPDPKAPVESAEVLPVGEPVPVLWESPPRCP